MKTLYTLGDSFMSVDCPANGIESFLDLYAKRKGFKHISLARPGATNFLIRLQIDRAIKDKPDFVIIGLTCSDRFDIPLDDSMDPNYLLENIQYQGYQSKSENHIDPGAPIRVVSDTFSNIDKNIRTNLLNDNHRDTIKRYISYLHNPALQQLKDYYMISDGLQKLEQAGIDFLLIPGALNRDWSCIKRVWPKDRAQPWSLPYGVFGWSKSAVTHTHNPQIAHDEFCETLMQITTDWLI